MNQQRISRLSTHPRRINRRAGRGSRYAGIIVLLALLISSLTTLSVRRPATAAVVPPTPAFTVTPTTGAAGSSVSLSVVNIQRIYDTGTIGLTFDRVPISPTPALSLCTNQYFGFGSQCNPNAPYSYTIPAGAAPGNHTFELTFSAPISTTLPAIDLTATFAVSGPPTLLVSPTSGPAGSVALLTALNLPASALLDGAGSLSLTFDKTPISPVPSLLQCTSGGYGFGTLCSASSPYPFPIPATATAGAHTFELIIQSASGGPLADLTAQFQVIAQATDTPTVTVIASDTPTATAAANTPAVPPTATFTRVPSATAPPVSTPTQTPTPMPKIGAVVGIVRPDFSNNQVAIFAKGSPGTKVHVDFVIMVRGAHGGSTKAFSSSADKTMGVTGTFSLNLKIHVTPYALGQATLTLRAVTPAGTLLSKRVYRYVVYT